MDAADINPIHAIAKSNGRTKYIRSNCNEFCLTQSMVDIHGMVLENDSTLNREWHRMLDVCSYRSFIRIIFSVGVRCMAYIQYTIIFTTLFAICVV